MAAVRVPPVVTEDQGGQEKDYELLENVCLVLRSVCFGVAICI